MSSPFDLHLFPLARGGKEPPVGLHVASSPRRAARGRHEDRLALFLTLTGSAPLPPEYLRELLSGLAKSYYETPGTVTAAQRLVAELLNDYLLTRNLRNAASGNQTLGVFTQVVLRGGRLFIAQSGPAHAFVITGSAAQTLYDPQLSGRGLGIGKTPGIRYAQTEPHPNDAIVLATQPPASWNTATLQSAHRQGLESLRRYLIDHMGGETEAVFIRVSPGEGRLQVMLSPQAEAIAAKQTAARPVAASPARPIAASPAPSVAASPARLVILLALLARGISRSARTVALGVLSLLQRMLPDESLFTIPPSLMFFVAVAVPLVVVTIASMTYFQRGRDSQYQIYFAQAQQAGQQARTKTEPREQHLAWATMLKLLAQAEKYRTTPDSESLHVEAQGVLDRLDAVERLDFRPALSGKIDEDVHITRMVVNENDLYLLDATAGKVLRATFTGSSYRLDATFECGPGAYEGKPVRAILAIAPLPLTHEQNAAVVGVDGDRTLLYCIPDSPPIAVSLAPPPTNWGKPLGLTIDSNDLYLLDPQGNAVWIYRKSNAAEQPQYFFGVQPPPMQDVEDLAVNRDDLFLLHADGHLTKCTFSPMPDAPTRCEDPINYTDTRPGRGIAPLIEGATFAEILFTPSPDASVYLLEAQTPAVYHFGMGLTLQRQYRSRSSLPASPATAFTISRSNHQVFLAFGNQVYFALLP